MPRNNSPSGSKWFECALCGFDYPEEFKTTQRGLDVCTFLPCFDEPGGQSDADDPRASFGGEPPSEDTG